MPVFSQELLDKSLAWIREHPCATNLELPKDLLELWISNNRTRGIPADDFHMSVFTYGLFCQKVTDDPSLVGKQLQLKASEVSELFDLWQIKLAMAELHHKSMLASNPLFLFRFPETEQVSFFQKAAIG